jgi:aldehyde dehydrogenase (NAD+)
MVLKPSEIAPLSGLLFAEVVDAAGRAAGCLQPGERRRGRAWAASCRRIPDVDMVSFTGSTRAGRLISKAAADTIKRVSLELGGKGANIIFADADRRRR